MTAPAPTACATCGGDGSVKVDGRAPYEVWTWCPACRCGICGQTTDTAPECMACAIREDSAAVRRADR